MPEYSLTTSTDSQEENKEQTKKIMVRRNERAMKGKDAQLKELTEDEFKQLKSSININCVYLLYFVLFHPTP